MTRPSRSLLPTVVATGAVLALLPAAANATDTGAVRSGTLSFVPGGTVGRALDRHDVSIRPHDGAVGIDDRIDVRAAGGYVGRVAVITQLRNSGLFLASYDGEVVLNGLRVKIGKRSEIRGRIDGGPRRLLFTTKATRLFGADGSGVVRRNSVTLRMTHGTARVIGRKLRIGRLRGGTFGKASLTAALAIPSPPAPPAPVVPPPPPAPVNPHRVTGTAVWGVKESFRRYIEQGFGSGRIDVADGALRIGTAGATTGFRFPATGDADSAAGTDWRYGGTVYLEGHGRGVDAQMRIWLRRPRIVVPAGATTGTMYADVTSRNNDIGGALVEYPNAAIATLDLTRGTRAVSGTTTTWTGVPVTLTEEGVPAFAGFYAPGTELDPITFSLGSE